MDKTPALSSNFTSTCDTLLENLGEETAKQAGVDIKAYKEELEKQEVLPNSTTKKSKE